MFDLFVVFLLDWIYSPAAMLPACWGDLTVLGTVNTVASGQEWSVISTRFLWDLFVESVDGSQGQAHVKSHSQFWQQVQ